MNKYGTWFMHMPIKMLWYVNHAFTWYVQNCFICISTRVVDVYFAGILIQIMFG